MFHRAVLGDRVKRLIMLLIVALVGFYVAWPAWSGYRIATAVTNQDEDLLASKADFPAIRESLRPVATVEIGKLVDKQAGSLAPVAAALGADLKKQLLGTIVDQALATAVTPQAVIRIANDRGEIAAAIEKVIAEVAGQVGAKAGTPAGNIGGILGQVMGTGSSGDLGGMAGKIFGSTKKPEAALGTAPARPAAATKEAAPKRSFGLANIKGFHMAGPFGFDVDVARDATQSKADATIGMSFSGSDWKLTRVVPIL